MDHGRIKIVVTIYVCLFGCCYSTSVFISVTLLKLISGNETLKPAEL